MEKQREREREKSTVAPVSKKLNEISRVTVYLYYYVYRRPGPSGPVARNNSHVRFDIIFLYSVIRTHSERKSRKYDKKTHTRMYIDYGGHYTTSAIFRASFFFFFFFLGRRLRVRYGPIFYSTRTQSKCDGRVLRAPE